MSPSPGTSPVWGFGGSADMAVPACTAVSACMARGVTTRGHGVLGEGNGQGTGVLGFTRPGLGDVPQPGGVGRGATFGSGGIQEDPANVNRELSFQHDDVMSTGGIAQLRLLPSEQLQPPKSGRIGDLYVRSEGGGEVKLFLCVQSSVGKDTQPRQPAKWAPVLLDTPVWGG
ncbi:MAG TPA: hypothetical protein VIV12_23310 [Streptosporangiaceae bacterium]